MLPGSQPAGRDAQGKAPAALAAPENGHAGLAADWRLPSWLPGFAGNAAVVAAGRW